MIILSGVLVVVAIALLVVGMIASSGDSTELLGVSALTWIYISIAVSIVSALCLAIGVLLRRKELFGTGAVPPARKDKAGKKPSRKERKAAKAQAAKTPAGKAPAGKEAGRTVPAEDSESSGETVIIPALPAEVPDDAVVYVVRGRKRYHLDSCRQLAGRDKEELTYVEAKEEGFSPCTACMPDTALAARAAASVPADTAEAADKPDSAEDKLSGKGAGDKAAAGIAGGSAAAAGSAPPRLDKPSSSARPGLDKPSGSRPAKPSSSPVPGKPAAATRTDLPSVAASAAAPGLEKPSPASGLDKPASGLDKPPAAPELEKPSAVPPAPGAVKPPSAWPIPSGDSAADEPAASLASAPVSDEPASPAAPEDEPTPWSSSFTEPEPDETDAPEPVDTPEPAPSVVMGSARRRTPEPAEAAEETEPADEPAQADDDPLVRILSGTKRYHRSTCALIEDIGDEADDLEAVLRSEAKSRGCTPCLVCQPDKPNPT